jgi:hypothetical protein
MTMDAFYLIVCAATFAALWFFVVKLPDFEEGGKP